MICAIACNIWLQLDRQITIELSVITKLGLKIKAFECFHFDCLREFWEGAGEMKIGK